MALEMKPSTSPKLTEAYAGLMSRAPGAAFHRARTLYLNKYPLPQETDDTNLRLFVVDEQLEETIQPAGDGNPSHRLVTLTSRPGALAIVHWQHSEPASAQQLQAYLCDHWNLDPAVLSIQPQDQPWFRDGGHQSRLSAPADLIWQQRSLLTLAE